MPSLLLQIWTKYLVFKIEYNFETCPIVFPDYLYFQTWLWGTCASSLYIRYKGYLQRVILHRVLFYWCSKRRIEIDTTTIIIRTLSEDTIWNHIIMLLIRCSEYTTSMFTGLCSSTTNEFVTLEFGGVFLWDDSYIYKHHYPSLDMSEKCVKIPKVHLLSESVLEIICIENHRHIPGFEM